MVSGPKTRARRPSILGLLSRLHSELARSHTGRRVLRAMGIRRFARAWLRTSVLPSQVSRPDAITVVIGTQNRADYRLANALTSIRGQSLPREAIRIIVVDYASRPEQARTTAEMCREYDARYVQVDGPRVWSRARCLNIGLRQVDTKFSMTSDADVLLSPRYLASALAVLKEDPMSVVCSPMRDLPEVSVGLLKRAALTDGELKLEDWRARSTPRPESGFHPSITVSYTAYYQLIRGYDEYYEVWGSEDHDLMRRLRYVGLDPRVAGPQDFYLHQWHPKFEGVREGANANEIARNRAYFRSNHSILRNGEDWGIPNEVACPTR